MRKKEDVYAKLRLGNAGLSDDALIKAMVANPVLIERPIVVNGSKAALGRPERGRGARSFRAPVPIAGILEVAFDAMKIGVNPGPRRIVLGLGEQVCLVPIAFGFVP